MNDPEETLREQAAVRQDEVTPGWAEQNQIEADQEKRHNVYDPWEDWNDD